MVIDVPICDLVQDFLDSQEQLRALSLQGVCLLDTLAQSQQLSSLSHMTSLVILNIQNLHLVDDSM
jgi:hypothetical protein